MNGILSHRAAGAHPVDLLVAWASSRSKLFSRGWGDEKLLAELSGCGSYSDAPGPISLKWEAASKRGRLVKRDGAFVSPLVTLPEQARTVHLRSLTAEGNDAACVMFAASRDEGYQVRERVFGPLAEQGIDLYLLENPFYGRRRAVGGPSFITVSDQGLMALGMVLEGRALLEHVREQISEAGDCRIQHGRTYGGDHRGSVAISDGMRSARHRRLGQQHLHAWPAVVERGPGLAGRRINPARSGATAADRAF